MMMQLIKTHSNNGNDDETEHGSDLIDLKFMIYVSNEYTVFYLMLG